MMSFKDSKMTANGVSELSEKMMEWNTPLGIVEAVISQKRASWGEGRILHLP